MADVVLESKKAKSGKNSIVKDDNGYYKVTLGALNTYNANGIFYKIDSLERVTGPKSILGSRIQNGLLRAEVGHPDFTGLTGSALLNRIFKIDLNNVCGHIKSVEFIDQGRSEPGWSGYPIYIVKAWVKPTGPKAGILQAALDNEDENAAFSIRSAVTEKRVGSTIVRNVLEISTYDYVHEPGVPISSQWNAAGIEHRDPCVNDDGCCCLDGSCLPTLEDIAKQGTESNEEIKSLIEKLKEEEGKKVWVVSMK